MRTRIFVHMRMHSRLRVSVYMDCRTHVIARFNREMEKVKKSIETNMNKRFAVIVASKGETAEWLNRLLNELWGNVVIPVLDAQVPAMLEQAFKVRFEKSINRAALPHTQREPL